MGTQFTKPPRNSEYLYTLLTNRGLLIEDKKRFTHYIEYIGYYRLTGYMYPFQNVDGTHNFKEPINFQTVLDHYFFDKKLRMIVLEVIERIKVGIRSKICNIYAEEFGAHWYMKEDLFNNLNLHSELLRVIKEYCSNSSDTFIKKYNSNYSNPALPPVWMVMEILTFGKLSSLFENLKDNDQKKQVAKDLDVVVPIFESWLKSINYIRNSCAHHSRLWNRRMPLKPRIPTRRNRKFLNHVDGQTNQQLYGTLCCILFLLQKINPTSSFKKRLNDLFEEYPSVNKAYMGFPKSYQEEAIWIIE